MIVCFSVKQSCRMILKNKYWIIQRCSRSWGLLYHTVRGHLPFIIYHLLFLGARGPGVFFIIPCVDIYEKIDLRVQNFDVPPQEVSERVFWSFFSNNSETFVAVFIFIGIFLYRSWQKTASLSLWMPSCIIR